MKKLFAFNLFCFFLIKISAQSISPAVSSEVCPNVFLACSGTMPGEIDGISGFGGIIQSLNFNNTNFSGTISFSDVNADQGIIVSFRDQNGIIKSHTFTYSKVKSFFFSSTCNSIIPSISSVCPELNSEGIINLTFNKINYKNLSVSGCFGINNTYDYLVPAGWKVNGVVSNGVTRIIGSNVANISYDKCNGNNQFIKIRGLNDCNTSLFATAETLIPITRCIPTMSIIGDRAPCRGSYLYSIDNFLEGSTVNWELNPSGLATINSSNQSMNLTVVQKGFATLTATISLPCNFGNIILTKNLNIGDQFVNPKIEGADCIDQVHLEYVASTDNPCYECSYNWAVIFLNQGTSTSSQCSISYYNNQYVRVFGSASGNKPCPWAGYSIGCHIDNHCSSESITIWHPIKVTRRGCCFQGFENNNNCFSKIDEATNLELIDSDGYQLEINKEIDLISSSNSDLALNLKNGEKIESIRISDLNGREIFSKNFSSPQPSELIDVFLQPNTIYLVSINNTHFIKFIK